MAPDLSLNGSIVHSEKQVQFVQPHQHVLVAIVRWVEQSNPQTMEQAALLHLHKM